jgi:A/G-specific adenine glycosylase
MRPGERRPKHNRWPGESALLHPVQRRCVADREDRAHEIPAPRPRKTLPRKSVTWLVLRRAGEVLLERRHALGIWGGLWCFPECPRRDIRTYCRSAFGCQISKATKLAPIEHGFTHFHLRITPVLCDLRSATLRADSPGRLWIDATDAEQGAIPVPVRKILRQL